LENGRVVIVSNVEPKKTRASVQRSITKTCCFHLISFQPRKTRCGKLNIANFLEKLGSPEITH